MHNINIKSVLSVFILGAISLAFIYHVVMYMYSKDKLIIHYLLYIFFSAVFAFSMTGFIAAYFTEAAENKFINIFYEAIQILYLAFYFNFILQSIEIENRKTPFLYRSWVAIMAVLIGYSIIFTIAKIIFNFKDYTIPFIGIRIFIFILTSIMLYKSYHLRTLTFQFYILLGCSVYFIFGITSFITNLYDGTDMFIYPPEWLIIGSFIDIVFFSIAINYRNKKQWQTLNHTLLQDANEMIAMQKIILEKQLALENERNRISQDMHDDLGSGLTKIAILSEVVKKQFENPEKAKPQLEKIADTSRELVDSLQDIIWILNTKNDTVESLSAYLREYGLKYFEPLNIKINFDYPNLFSITTLTEEQRRNTYLTIKEIFNNIAKHAQCNTVYVNMCEQENEIIIQINDNGIGFDINHTRQFANGLKNMKTRIEIVGGKFIIQSKINEGTQIIIIFKK
ncbi:MAG: histidine kinase [Ferruginibacter sp.]